MERDDGQLVRAYREGDDRALETLIRRYARPLFGYVRGFFDDAAEAEDVAQDAIVKAWKHLGRFDEAMSFKAWLFAIARHTALDALKRRKATPFSAFEDDGGNALLDRLEDPGDWPDELVAQKDFVEAAARAAESLPPAQREVLRLRHEHELSFKEMGEVLGEALDTVKTRYRRAVAALRKRLSR